MKCPICNGHFRRFLPVKERKSAYCPKCGSFERHRLIFLYLKQTGSFFTENLRVLHVAPHKILQNKMMRLKNLDYISINIIPKSAMYTMDLTKLSFEENYFDIIICSHVLEHIPNDQLAMQELYRVLKKGGWGLILVPIDIKREETLEDSTIEDPNIRKEIFGEIDHLRLYGLDFIDRLKSIGFDIKLDDYLKELDDSVIKLYGLDRSENIFVVYKNH
jgi:SAM-dependent methyltransferase